MNGVLAAIYKEEEQIGGPLDWTVDIVKHTGSDGENKTTKVIRRVFTARKHFRFEDVEMPVRIVFFKFEEGTLFRVHTEQCGVIFRGERDVVNTQPIDISSWVEGQLN